MTNSSKEHQEKRAYADALITKINAFTFSSLPAASKGKELHLNKAKKSIESYRNVYDLTNPHVLINFFYSIKSLPAELLVQASGYFMKELVEKLLDQAQVRFVPESGELQVAGYPVAVLESVAHIEVLKRLLEQEPGTYRTAKELRFSSDDEHQLAALAVYLKRLNLADGLDGVSPLYPLQILGKEVDTVDSDGRSYKSWAYSVASSFGGLTDHQSSESE